jgi:hypothetical protein
MQIKNRAILRSTLYLLHPTSGTTSAQRQTVWQVTVGTLMAMGWKFEQALDVIQAEAPEGHDKESMPKVWQR